MMPTLGLFGGCADGEDVAPATTAPVVTPATACVPGTRLAVFDIHGTLTTSDEALLPWLQDPPVLPDPRAGAAELVAAYRQRGYGILYITGTPTWLTIAGQSAADALTGWLAANGFPTGEGTWLHTWSTAGREQIEVVDELVRLAGSDMEADVGYLNNAEDVSGLILGGVPAERIFTLGNAAGVERSSALPNDDLVAHRDTLQGQPWICGAG